MIADNHITYEKGTGVVHCAPAFGEDDYRVCAAAGLICKVGTSCVCCRD